MFALALPITKQFADVAKIVAYMILITSRPQLLQQKCSGNFPAYASFEEMVTEAKPDIVIITTIDRYHHEYKIKAMPTSRSFSNREQSAKF